MTQPSFYFDTAFVFYNSITVMGWSEGSAPVSVFYDGFSIPSVVTRSRREDLVAKFGERAATWGFTLCAVAPVQNLIHDRISLEVGGYIRPIAHVTNPADSNGNALFSSFQRATSASPGSMLELGARARSGNSYKQFFPEASEYVGIDMLAGPGVDVVCDAHEMAAILQRQFDYVFSVSVFEHLLMPWKAALEMNKVMRPGALGFIQSHHGWPLHEEPWDFWRFSAESWKGLFNKHTGFEVVESGYDLGAFVLPKYAIGGPMQNLERHNTYLLSACIVKKVSEPLVSWDARVSDVYDLSYDHA